MLWIDRLSKKLHYNMIFLALSGKMKFIFEENIFFFRRKLKDDLSQKSMWKCNIPTSVLKRWPFQITRPEIWSLFNYREGWYFCFPEIWSHSLSLYFEVIFKSSCIIANYVYSRSNLYRYILLKIGVILQRFLSLER